ncbi:glycine cleavage system protein GcvH [Streptomyces sp. NPDC096132]|uniref:glycine cleavage system protein GcvH n=1 Tax=Streptomyces sp. NPDC096132 TaxID=3366075 RepID=UPI003806F5E6
MSYVPADLRYTQDHEWVRTEANGVAAVGITDHAQKNLGDIVFVELPEVGRKLAVGDAFGTVESVKAVSEIFSPLEGEVVEVNQDISSEPEEINSEPYETWFVKIKVKAGASSNGLLDAKAYEKLIAGE